MSFSSFPKRALGVCFVFCCPSTLAKSLGHFTATDQPSPDRVSKATLILNIIVSTLFASMDTGIYPHTVVQIPRKTGGKACYCGADCGYIRVTAEHWKTTCLIWWVPTSLSFRFKLNIYVDTRDILNYDKTVLLRDTIHQTSSGESAATVKYQGWCNLRSAPAADSLREFWRTVSQNNTVLSLSRDVKTTKINQYSNVSNSRFQKHILNVECDVILV